MNPREAALLLVERGVSCRNCLKKPGKYLGWVGYACLMCLECYAVRRASWERQESQKGRVVTGSLVGPQCPSCDSDRVDADGVTWWCEECSLRMGWRPEEAAP